jgi:UDP-glucose 4-epimerase
MPFSSCEAQHDHRAGGKRRERGVRALVTGGAGFIGSHLVEALLAQGHAVRVIDDLSTGSMDNLSAVRTHAAFDCVVDSAANAPRMTELVGDADIVFHLAAAVGVRLIVESPVRTIETNVHGTQVVLAAASRRRTPVVVFSTSEVYGKNNDVPFREDADLVLGATSRRRWAYACSKALDEFLGLAYWHERQVPVVILRPFNTVGPRQTGRYGMVIPSFVRQALRGDPLTVYGDGRQTRCFTDVSDVVDAVMRLAWEPRAVGQVVNIGSTNEIAILDLAERVRQLAGSRSEIVFVPYDRAYAAGFEDMPRRVPDLRRLQSLIDFQPRFDIDGILTRTITSVRSGASPASSM